MPTLVATPKASNANVYADVTRADAYHAKVMSYDTIWANAIEDIKGLGLITATMALDNLIDWNGLPTSETQALRAPRTGWTDRDGRLLDPDVIPVFLEDATSELAKHCIERNLYLPPDGQGFTRIKAGPLEAQRSLADTPMVLPHSVWVLVRGFGVLRDPNAGATRIRLAR